MTDDEWNRRLNNTATWGCFAIFGLTISVAFLRWVWWVTS